MGLFRDLYQQLAIGNQSQSTVPMDQEIKELQARVANLETVVGELLRELDEGIDIDIQGNVNSPLAPHQ